MSNQLCLHPCIVFNPKHLLSLETADFVGRPTTNRLPSLLRTALKVTAVRLKLGFPPLNYYSKVWELFKFLSKFTIHNLPSLFLMMQLLHELVTCPIWLSDTQKGYTTVCRQVL